MRVGALFSLRLLATLGRISKALDTANAIGQARLELEQERLRLEHPKWTGKPQTAVFTEARVEDLNKGWADRHGYTEE